MTLDLSALSAYTTCLRSNPEANAELIAKFDLLTFAQQCEVASAWMCDQEYPYDLSRARDNNELYGDNT